MANDFLESSSWPLGTLGDDVRIQGRIGWKGYKTSDLRDSGPLVVGGANVKSRPYIDRTGIKHLSREKFDESPEIKLKEGDVLLVTRGNLADAAYVDASIGEATINPSVIILAEFKGDPKYLYYYLASPVGRENVLSLSSGSSVPAIYQAHVKKLQYPKPPLAEQKAIAAVLGALDDKIELNRRMNATLEAMARALFQSWFVDFDPVRAKLDGRKPTGLDETTAALFPDSFQESSLGHIPKGWTVGKVSDLATLNRSAVNPGDFPAETFDHFSLPSFDNGRTPKLELGSGIMSNKFTVTQNSVLLSKLNPHIPRIWLPDLHASRRSVCSTEFMVACSKPGVSREYLFSLFTSSAFASVYGTLVTGTTGSHQRIRPESVLDMKTVIPPPALIRAFTDIAKPMFDRINRNTEQSRTLATIRDTLLPKLLSGELRGAAVAAKMATGL